MKPDILYTDNHLLVINKPSGLLAQKDSTGDPDIVTLAKDFIKQTFQKPGDVYLGLVHRLDRPASGIMVLARTSKAAARLSAQFRACAIKKKYLALVEGACPGRGTSVNYIIKKDRQVTIVEAVCPGAQYAELFWESIAQKNNLSLLSIDMKTGRPHQIRVQLSHMGFPILGDLRYGAKKEFDGQNLALHCYLLGLEHPVKKEHMQWTQLPPPAWGGMFENEIEGIVMQR